MHLVSQHNPLFKGTVRDNLLCGRTNISDAEINKALALSEAAEFVTQKGGLDTEVLEHGHNFSGGQRQRLCIARALLGQPEIVIFDDALSALDFATEAKIRRNLANWQNGKTLLFISQRIHVVQNADCIYVLEDGQLAAHGTHASLLENSPLYAEICRSQDALQEGTR